MEPHSSPSINPQKMIASMFSSSSFIPCLASKFLVLVMFAEVFEFGVQDV